MKVLLTVDTELWPQVPDFPRGRPASRRELVEAYQSCMLGRTASGDLGLPRLLADLARHELKAVFLVEALAAEAGAADLLAEAVAMIQSAGQEVQLHAHTEWVSSRGALALDTRQFFTDYDEREQRAIIAHARTLLEDAGARSVTAFRAGNMRANAATVRAAAAAGITTEMSFLAGAMPSAHDMAGGPGCTVLPVNGLRYRGSRSLRPAQLGAVSAREMRSALGASAAAGAEHFCILLHSFELVTRTNGLPRPHAINVSRWTALCELLARRRREFTTVHCRDIDPWNAGAPAVVRGMYRHLPERWAEQAWSRLF